MTAVSAGRSTRIQRRVNPAVGTAAAWSLRQQSVSAHSSLASFRRLAIPRPTAPWLTSAYGLARIGCSQMALHRSSHTDPRCGIPECRPGKSPARTLASPSDPMLAPADASKPPHPDFQPTSHVAMSPKGENK
ncbi:MAG: hypothetical protein QOF67_485 [Mycobacterium sp.]|jgi:hypothetical protein|nr:hypothetical protein [Mycobacterium sp.]